VALAAEHGDLGARALEVLDASLADLFGAAADDLVQGAEASNRDMLARAESVLLRTVSALKEALQGVRRGSEAQATPEAAVNASSAALLATALADVKAGLAFVVAECGGRPSFAEDQAAEASRLSAGDVAEVASSWAAHAAKHLDAESTLAVAALRATVAATYTDKEGALPVKSGELELFASAELKGATAALCAVGGALGLEEATEAVASRRADLVGRLEVELKGLRTKNAELLRRRAAPDPPAFGKLVGSDTMVGALVLVPQPNTHFSERVEEVEVDRKPSGAGAVAIAVTGAHEVSVEVGMDKLTNGRAYTLTARARNANGWGAWSVGAQCVPFGVPPAPSVGTATPGDGTVTLALDFKGAGDNGSAVTAYRVTYRPAAGGGAGGEATVPVDPAAPLSLTCKGLSNGTSYDFEVAAVNQAGPGAVSAKARCSPAPPPPKPRIQRVVPMDTALQVSMVAATDAGNPDPLAAEEVGELGGGQFAVTSYEVTIRMFGAYSFGAPETKVFEAGAVNAFILRGLTNGASYNVTVVAVNAIGKSPPSGVVVASPNTPWGAFKKVFSFCSGPAASSQAVVEQPSGDEEPGQGPGRAAAMSVAVEFGDVYAKK
jgi:hypothetical protein